MSNKSKGGYNKEAWTDQEVALLRSLIDKSMDDDNEQVPKLTYEEIAQWMQNVSKDTKLNDCNRVYTACSLRQFWVKVKAADRKKRKAASRTAQKAGASLRQARQTASPGSLGEGEVFDH